MEREAPSLALLDRTPLDDAGMRTRLNEAWPDYTAPLRWRLGTAGAQRQRDLFSLQSQVERTRAVWRRLVDA